MVECAKQAQVREPAVVIWKRRGGHAASSNKQWVDARVEARLERIVREAALPLGANVLAPPVQPSAPRASVTSGDSSLTAAPATTSPEQQPKRPGTALLVLRKTDSVRPANGVAPEPVREAEPGTTETETQARRAGLGDLLVTP